MISLSSLYTLKVINWRLKDLVISFQVAEQHNYNLGSNSILIKVVKEISLNFQSNIL